jgi:hypothetical protein
MKQRLILWLRLALAYLEGPAPIPDPPPVEDSLGVAMALMQLQDSIAGRSGEAKRHQVLAALLKSGLSESDAAMAIERVIQLRKGRYWALAAVGGACCCECGKGQ